MGQARNGVRLVNKIFSCPGAAYILVRGKKNKQSK